MIIDSIQNIENYKGLEKIYDVLTFLKRTDFSSMPAGKYEIDGDAVYYMVQDYETKPNDNVAECHMQYIDVQYVVQGEEQIGYAPITCEKSLVKESKEDDYQLYKIAPAFLTVKSGDFMVLYPNDIHKPGVMTDSPAPCRKIVCKVRI